MEKKSLEMRKILDLEKKVAELQKALYQLQRNSPPWSERMTAQQVANITGHSLRKIREDTRRGLLICRYPNAKHQCYHPTDVDYYMRGLRKQKDRRK